MRRLLLDQDIHSLSEFRAKVTSLVQKVRKNHRPVVITHRGKSAAVLMDVGDYEALLGKLELVQDIRDGELQIGRGEGVPHDAAKKQVLAKIKQ